MAIPNINQLSERAVLWHKESYSANKGMLKFKWRKVGTLWVCLQPITLNASSLGPPSPTVEDERIRWTHSYKLWMQKHVAHFEKVEWRGQTLYRMTGLQRVQERLSSPPLWTCIVCAYEDQDVTIDS